MRFGTVLFLPGPLGVWDSESVNVLASAICAEDVTHWTKSPGLLVKWVSFLGSLHWPAGGLDLGLVACLMWSFSFFMSSRQVKGSLWRRLILGIFGQGVQFQCRLFLLVQALIFGAHAVSLVL